MGLRSEHALGWNLSAEDQGIRMVLAFMELSPG
jgi:hypothetical protein